jgi:hypothetical protein
MLRAPGRTRTSDTRFRKPVLYPLSYGGGTCKSWSTTTGPLESSQVPIHITIPSLLARDATNERGRRLFIALDRRVSGVETGSPRLLYRPSHMEPPTTSTRGCGRAHRARVSLCEQEKDAAGNQSAVPTNDLHGEEPLARRRCSNRRTRTGRRRSSKGLRRSAGVVSDVAGRCLCVRPTPGCV